MKGYLIAVGDTACGKARHHEELAMKVTLSRRGFMQAAGAGSISAIAGCGMILHPERRNQPPGGGLDWKIVALDAVGLLLFFIPGVIAFAVDFTTGAIYLPPPGYGDAGTPANDNRLTEIKVPPAELSPQRVEQVASEHTGRDVKIVRTNLLTERLTKITDFWRVRDKLAGEPS